MDRDGNQTWARQRAPERPGLDGFSEGERFGLPEVDAKPLAVPDELARLAVRDAEWLAAGRGPAELLDISRAGIRISDQAVSDELRTQVSTRLGTRRRTALRTTRKERR